MKKTALLFLLALNLTISAQQVLRREGPIPADLRLTYEQLYESDLLNNNLNSEIVNAPTYSSNSSSHISSRYITFGLTWRIGKLDLEWQVPGGAAGE